MVNYHFYLVSSDRKIVILCNYLFYQGDGTLKPNLIDELDYTLLSEEAWNKFIEWYGYKDGQEPISRKVIAQGKFTLSYRVEVYPLCINLCNIMKPEHVVERKYVAFAW